MALSGSFLTTGGYQGRVIEFKWTATQDIARNYSNISWNLYGAGSGTSGWYTQNIKVTINGVSVYSTSDPGGSPNTQVILKPGVAILPSNRVTKVPHNSDGTKSFVVNIEAAIYNWSPPNTTGSGTFTLNSIPRTSSFTATNANFGNSSTITISRASSSFTHTLEYTCGTASGVIATKTSSTSLTWKIPDSLITSVTTGKSVSTTITCTTYSGSTSIGSTTKNITLTIPDSYASTTTVSNATIGANVSVNISSKSTAFKHTVTWTFGSLNGTLVTKGSGTSFSITTNDNFYNQIPNSKSGTGQVTCVTYINNTQIGTSKTTSFTLNANSSICTPLINSPTVEQWELDPSIELTGGADTYIPGYTTFVCNASFVAQKGATFTERKIGGQTYNGSEIKLENFSGQQIVFECKDSREFTNTFSKSISYLSYTEPNFSCQVYRTNMQEASLEVNYNYWADNFGLSDNAIAIQYRYKSSQGEFSEWIDIVNELPVSTLQDWTYGKTATIEDISFEDSYIFEIRIQDSLQALYDEYSYVTVNLGAGKPIFNWGSNYFNFNVPVSISTNDPNCVAVIDNQNKIASSEITTTELWNLKNIRDNIQYQLDSKADSDSYLPLAGGTVTGTLVLSKTTDASGTADNGPALIVGGTRTTAHMEMDANEILAKSNGTTPAQLNLNTNGGLVVVGAGGLRLEGAVANRALVTNASKNIVVSSVTATELGYLDGVTSNIQTQLNNRPTSFSKLVKAGTMSQDDTATVNCGFTPTFCTFLMSSAGSTGPWVGGAINLHSTNREFRIYTTSSSYQRFKVTLSGTNITLTKTGSDTVTIYFTAHR